MHISEHLTEFQSMANRENDTGTTLTDAIFWRDPPVEDPLQSENQGQIQVPNNRADYRDNVDETTDETEARDNAAINGITDGIIRKYIREPIFNYPVYSPRLHDQMNDPISLFGSRQYSKWLRNFIFNGIIEQKNYFCKVNLTLGDLQIVFKRARQVFIGLITHTSVRRQITWRDYLTYLEMIIFLFDLLAGASRNCLLPSLKIENVHELYSTSEYDLNKSLFSLYNRDILVVLSHIPSSNVYKRWLVFKFYYGLRSGDYQGLESFLVRWFHWVSPQLLSKIFIISLVVLLLYMCCTYQECFVPGILIFTLGSLQGFELNFLIVPSRDLLYFCYSRLESFLAMCSDWISPPILSKMIIISLLGSFSLCFTYTSYFLCKILISSVCKMVFLQSSCLMVAIRYIIYRIYILYILYTVYIIYIPYNIYGIYYIPYIPPITFLLYCVLFTLLRSTTTLFTYPDCLFGAEHQLNIF